MDKENPEKTENLEEEIDTSSELEQEESPETSLEGETSEKTEERELSEKEIKSLHARKEHYKRGRDEERAKRQELEQKLKELEKKAEVSNLTDDEWKQRVDFALEKSEVAKNGDFLDLIQSVARGKGISLNEAFELPDIQSAWNSRVEKSRKEENIPEPSSRQFLKVKEKPVHELSDEEIKKNYPEILNKVLTERKKRQNR